MQSARESIFIWVPYMVLIGVVVAWTGPWSHLPAISWFRLSISAASSITQRPVTSVFNFTPFGGGTSTLVSWLIILAILRPSGEMLSGKIFAKTFKQMWGALLVAFFIFALAYIFVFHRDGQFAGLRAVENRAILRGVGAGAGLDRCGAFGKQRFDERDVRAGASDDRAVAESAGAVVALVQFGGGGSRKTDRAANGERGCFHEQAGEKRRPGDPSQHGMDAGDAGVPDFDFPGLLLLVPESDDALAPTFLQRLVR